MTKESRMNEFMQKWERQSFSRYISQGYVLTPLVRVSHEESA